MGYVILALLTLPFLAVWMFLLAIATGIIHEPTEIESTAKAWRTSWKSAHQ